MKKEKELIKFLASHLFTKEDGTLGVTGSVKLDAGEILEIIRVLKKEG